MGEVYWVAEVFQDWTTLQIVESGDAFAFNRATGRVYKLPHPDCPFIQILGEVADRTGDRIVLAPPTAQEWSDG